MKHIHLSPKILTAFQTHLHYEEKSRATIEKYLRDARAFAVFAQDRPLTKELVIAYKESLITHGYATRSINSMLVSINRLLDFIDQSACKVKMLRCQRPTYCPADQELTKAEYLRLLQAAKSRPGLHLILQTICGTGIRVSELRCFTVEAVHRGEITVHGKNKTRTILVPGKLKKILLLYARQRGIKRGIIFTNKKGKPLDRFYIWAQMKRLCTEAKVDPQKVFPHNLRKLFARTFYSIEKDIAKLADILGHSSINTTRIYIMTTSTEHRRRIERLGLVI